MTNLLIKKYGLLILILWSLNFYGQYQNKDTIYVKFELNDGSQPKYRGIKKHNQKEKSIMFNDINIGSFLFSYNTQADTLNIKRLSDYKFIDTRKIDSLINIWKIKNKNGLIDYYGKIYPPFDKNGMFQTYLIELYNEECFIIYPVIWRSEGVKQ